MVDNQTVYRFSHHHIGPDESGMAHRLSALGIASLDDLMRQIIPESIVDDLLMELQEALDRFCGAMLDIYSKTMNAISGT